MEQVRERFRSGMGRGKGSFDHLTLKLPASDSRLPLNLVAADVRRLTLLWAEEVRASLRRLLQFRGSKRESVRAILTPKCNCARSIG